MHKKSVGLLLGSAVLTVGVISTLAFVNHKQNQQVKIVDAADYYASVTDSMSGTTLLNQLNSIIDTSSVSVSYDWSRYEAADEDPNNSSNVILIYARNSVAKTAHVSGNTGWNREHTFPQSKLSNSKAEKDNHIIFASDNKVNGARSNIKMGVVTGGTVVNDYFGNPTTCRKTSSAFDPNNVARGIVARSTMYAAAMYGYDPTDNFESIATMLSWHLEYTPTSQELTRNNTVQANQKNRNPFVDHPEYACRIWGNTNSTTQSICGLSGNVTISKTNASLTIGGTTTISATSSNSSTITWTTSNSSIASISAGSASSGSSITITGVAAGTATITAKATINNTQYTKTCAVTVSAPKTLSSIGVSGQKTTFSVGSTFTFGGTVTAYYTDSSSADVTSNATFSGYNLSNTGNQTVTVSYTEGGVTKTTTYTITVSQSVPTSSETIVTSEQGYTNQQDVTSITGSNCTITFDAGSNSNTPKYYNTGSAVRLYGTNTMTISSTTKTIVGIELTFGSGDGSLEITASPGTWSSPNWTGSASSVTFTVASGAGNRRIASIKITYEESGSSSPTITSISLDTDDVEIFFEVGDTFSYSGLVVTANYNNGTSQTVTNYTVSSPDMSTAGDKTITVTYSGCTATYEITVTATGTDPTPTEYSLTANFPYMNGVAYKMYFYSTNKSKNYYFAGGKTGSNNQYGSTSETMSSGVDVYFEESGTGHNIFFVSSLTKYYLEVAKVNTYYNFNFTTTEPTIKWDYNTTYSCMTFTLDSTIYSFGTYSSYTTFSAYDIAAHSDNYRVQFVTSGTAAASIFATLINEKITCDSTGSSAPSIASGFSWAIFANIYANLDGDISTSGTSKYILKNATANSSGSDTEKFVARYDYIVAKYGTSSYTDFLGRNPSRMSGLRISFFSDVLINDNSLLIIAIATSIIALSIGGYFFFRRKKQQ